MEPSSNRGLRTWSIGAMAGDPPSKAICFSAFSITFTAKVFISTPEDTGAGSNSAVHNHVKIAITQVVESVVVTFTNSMGNVVKYPRHVGRGSTCSKSS